MLAIQGDFDKHVKALDRCGVEPVEIRTPDELVEIERLIVPGGESTTVGLLMQRYGMADAVRAAAAAGMPMWGTCMGMILMARAVVGRPHQFSLGILDVEIERNAFGSQVFSFEAEIDVPILGSPILGIFIRAPVVSRIGAGVSLIATYLEQIVAVRQGNVIGTSFHPELTNDLRFHEWFLSL